jgi:hypothetical protein
MHSTPATYYVKSSTNLATCQANLVKTRSGL